MNVRVIGVRESVDLQSEDTDALDNAIRHYQAQGFKLIFRHPGVARLKREEGERACAG